MVVAVLSGDYDLSKQEQLRADLDEVADLPDLVLDMSAVTFMDSTCITELVRLHNYRLAEHGPLTIAGSENSVKRVFSLLKLGRLFHLVGAIAEVLPTVGESVLTRYLTGGDDAYGVVAERRTH